MNLNQLSAYELVKTEEIKDLKSEGMILRHKKTGARISLISNDDENKVFYIGFRTPSQDSTGVAHIVEHSVLCGSKDFPAKDPFVELAKGSLNTFLNAMTYPDKTVYPVASCNDTDFKNLMHVYMDAVLYPNIYAKKEIFQQEAWHYELESEDDALNINGVVYNEMKGAFSSPEGILDRQILNALHPNTSYKYESGGDPEDIPKLSYEGFLDFHKKYYHPSNSYLYLYGDMDMEERLDWLDKEYLSKFEPLDIDSRIRVEPAFEKPVEISKLYPISSEERLEENSYLSCSYSVDSILDEKLYIAFDILDYALLGAPGAPLKKALLDAQIGKDIMSSFDNSTLQPFYSIVAKNSDRAKKEGFLSIIKTVLQEQVEQGILKKSLMAALNSTEFRYREADFGSYPKGLMYGLQCLDSWLYDDGVPFLHLNALEVIAFLKEQVEGRYFEDLIQKYLLDNTHVAVVMVEPKRGLNQERDQKLEEDLAAYKKSLSSEEIQTIIAETTHLREYQQEPSTKEDLEKIPLLTREDLKKEAQPYVNEKLEFGGRTLLFHEVESNGIAYLNLLFGADHIAKEDIPYVGILHSVLGYVDTQHYSYNELANEINLHTGGISGNVNAYGSALEGHFEEYKSFFEVRTKVLYEKVPKALELIEEILKGSSLTDTKRLYEIIAQMKSRLQMSLSAAGHSVAAVRATSYFSETAKYQDLTLGIGFYRVVSEIEENFEEKKEFLVKKLEGLIHQIFRKDSLLISLGSEKEGLEVLKSSLLGLMEQLWTGEIQSHHDKLILHKDNEGFMDASQVQYVARAGNFRKAGFAYTGALRILKGILSYDYLWQNVRVMGGAYGAMTGFSRSGVSYFTSYRDPHLARTNEVYEGVVEYLKTFTAEERDITKYMIGTFSELDRPLTPIIQGMRSLNAWLTGLTLEDIQKERDEILSADQESIRDLADLVEAVLKEDAFCVIGNEEKLREHADLFGKLESLYES